MNKKGIDSIIKLALDEDIPYGDITSDSIISKDSFSKAVILAKEKGILAGIHVARRVFEDIDNKITFKSFFDDGHSFNKGKQLAMLDGSSISLLKGERTALNFLQRMCGIATITRKFVKCLEGTKTKILDTRKTTPGLRALEKYAVKMGGGINHRLNLSEMVLIKDNHIRLVGSVSKAVTNAREKVKPRIKIEVEATNVEEVREAIEAKADIIMLDNMPLETMKEVVDLVRGRILLEASGNIDLKKAKQIAELGIDFISVGHLTHSYSSIDISMEFI